MLPAHQCFGADDSSANRELGLQMNLST
jgi:hypothetical protein